MDADRQSSQCGDAAVIAGGMQVQGFWCCHMVKN
jgi:hypothetical protein